MQLCLGRRRSCIFFVFLVFVCSFFLSFFLSSSKCHFKSLLVRIYSEEKEKEEEVVDIIIIVLAHRLISAYWLIG